MWARWSPNTQLHMLAVEAVTDIEAASMGILGHLLFGSVFIYFRFPFSIAVQEDGGEDAICIR